MLKIRPSQSLGGAQVNFGAPFTKNILVDITLDNSTFIGFSTVEHEDNYSREDIRVLPWLSVYWINKQRGFEKSRESYSVIRFSFET